jgi:hypothetical protein
MDHVDSDWYALFTELMHTNPFCVTEDQLFTLLATLGSEECWKQPRGSAPPDLMMLPARYHPEEPMVKRVMRAMLDHIEFEYTRQQFACIMLRVIESGSALESVIESGSALLSN